MKKLLFFVLAFAFAVSLTGVVLAQTSTIAVPKTGITPTGFGTGKIGEEGITGQQGLINVIVSLIQWVAWIVGLLAVVMGLYAGILFITAGGDSGKVETARNILLYAIVGIVVAIIAFGLVAISKALVGIA